MPTPNGEPAGNPSAYRPAAGIAIFNQGGKVWFGKRAGERTDHVWQFPQGGIDPSESSKAAAMRELWEETGLKEQHVELLGRVEDWLYYDFPPEYKGHKRLRGWRGQRQRWYAVRLITDDSHFDLKAHMPIEFSEWRWGHLQDAPDIVVPFKRKVYERLAAEFEKFTKPV